MDDERIEGQTDWSMDGWMDEWINGHIVSSTDEQIDGEVKNGWMDR